MKKKLLSALILLFSINIYAEGITSLFGIPFGTSEELFYESLTAQGWTEVRDRCVFSSEYGTYAGLDVAYLYTYTYDDYFFGFKIDFKEENKELVSTKFKEFVKKFKLELIETEDHEIKYQDENGNEYLFYINEFRQEAYFKVCDGKTLQRIYQNKIKKEQEEEWLKTLQQRKKQDKLENWELDM